MPPLGLDQRDRRGEPLERAARPGPYGQEDHELDRFQRESLGNLAAELCSARLKSIYAPLIDLLESGGLLTVAGVGTWELSRGRISIGGLLVFLTYLNQLYSPIRRLGRLGNSVFAASSAAERVIEFLDQRPSVVERPQALELRRARGTVVFDSVSFRYAGTREHALSDVSLAVAPGETLALVGPSGAGKSTIAKLVVRFYDPEGGRISIDGHDVRHLTLRSLRANVALLLQETLVFDGTVRENIAYGRPDATDEEVVMAAAAADAHEFILALPERYDTLVGQKGRLLSGGQRQRLAIARATLRDAPILLLDEPTTGLDADSAERILAPLRRLMEGRATIVISHNLLTVRDATTILVLENGRITGRGSHEELIGASETYRRLYERHRLEAPASA